MEAYYISFYSNLRHGTGVASFPGLPHSFCSSVCVDNNTRMRKSVPRRLAIDERTRLGIIHHVSDVRWTRGGHGGGGGGGGVVVSAGPEGCSSSSQLGLNAPRLVETLRRST